MAAALIPPPRCWAVPRMVALLLSSGYIGLRILELEQQLASVGARPDLNLRHQ